MNGKRAGIYITVGLCSGLLVHTALIAVGISAIALAHPMAFTLLKIVGASYLIYLAWQAFKADSTQLIKRNETSKNFYSLYKKGFIMNITNPKVAIFFLAFLPQFTIPERGDVWLQLVSLGFLFIVCAFSIFCSIAMLSGTLKDKFFSKPSMQNLINKLAGLVFVALAIKLLITTKG